MKLNESSPKLSVIVAVYGEDEYLPSCIESIINQSYKNLELILVDDGSPDRCPEICDEYALRDSRIKVIHKINAGLVEARKTGVRMSSGDYIAYVDGDDEVDLDYYEKLINVAISEDVQIVVDGFCKSTNNKLSHRYLNAFACGKYNKEDLIKTIYPAMLSNGDFYSFGIYTYVWNKLFKREIVLENQLSVPSQLIVGEDTACVYPALISADSIYITDICGYKYRQRAGSLLRLRKNNVAMIERLINCRKYLMNRFIELDCLEVMKSQIDYYISSQLIMLSDCLIDEDSRLKPCFPYNGVMPDDKVIIYSAGAFGRHLYSQYKSSNCCNLVALADPDYEVLDTDIVSLEEAIKNPYDKIIVASVDHLFITEAVAEMKDLDIKVEKIVTINSNIDFVLQYCMTFIKGK